jgi:hypothetical protein
VMLRLEELNAEFLIQKLSGKCSEGDLTCVFGFKKRPMEAPAPPLGGPRSTASRPTPIFQTVSLAKSMDELPRMRRGSLGGIMAVGERRYPRLRFFGREEGENKRV